MASENGIGNLLCPMITPLDLGIGPIGDNRFASRNSIFVRQKGKMTKPTGALTDNACAKWGRRKTSRNRPAGAARLDFPRRGGL
jgi:hypothetical protein